MPPDVARDEDLSPCPIRDRIRARIVEIGVIKGKLEEEERKLRGSWNETLPINDRIQVPSQRKLLIGNGTDTRKEKKKKEAKTGVLENLRGSSQG